jgi:molybdopterin synthase sulfur carrier subunit
MVQVRIPTPLRKLTGGQGEVAIDAADITSLIGALETAYPGLKERLCDEQGEIRRFINIYVNNEDIRFQKGIGTAIKSGDEISIVPAIAGGAGRPANGRSPLGPVETAS